MPILGVHEKCSNFFVFQYFLIKFSVRSDLHLKRTNPGSFVATCTLG